MSVLFLAPLVMVQRMPQLWFEALHPNPTVSEETRLAVSEKISAFAEGIAAGNMAAMMAPANIFSAMLEGRSPIAAALAVPRAIANAAAAPIEARVRHNLKRLSRPLRRRSRSTKA